MKTVDPQGTALAKLMRLPEAEAGFVAMAQQLGFAFFVDMIIVSLLLGWELLPRAESMRKEKVAAVEPAAVIESEPAPLQMQPVLEPEAAPDTGPEKLTPLPRPRLVAARKEPPAGSVSRIMTGCLEPAKGQCVGLEEAYLRYADVCKAEGRPPVTSAQFTDAMVGFCKTVRIKTKIAENKVLLMNVQLQNSQPASLKTVD